MKARRPATDRVLGVEAHTIRSIDLPDGQPIIAFTVRRRFPLVAAEALTAEAEKAFPVVDASLSAMEALAPVRHGTDVCLLGHAYGGDAPSVDVVVEVGDHEKHIVAHGPRRVTRRGGGYAIVHEGPASRVPLTWENAFGGADEEALEFLQRTGMAQTMKRPAIDFRNPCGTGYRAAGGLTRLVDAILPGLDAPGDPITLERIDAFDDFRELPGPSVLAPFLPYHLGLLDRLSKVRELRVTGMAQDGLCELSIVGGEPFVLQGVTPGRQRIEGSLPWVRPRATLRFEGATMRRPPLGLRSVVFLPDLACFDLTFAGYLPVVAPLPDEVLARILRRAEVIWLDERN